MILEKGVAMATKPIARHEGRSSPTGEDLAFLKNIKNLSNEENALLAVAALNGNDILEESDFRNSRARKLLTSFQVPPNPLSWSRELVLMKVAERIGHPPFPPLITDLLKEMVGYLKYTPLSTATLLVSMLAGLTSQAKAPLVPRAVKAYFRTLMYLYEFLSLNRKLKMDGGVAIFSDDLAARMNKVLSLIMRGKIPFDFTQDPSSQNHIIAQFDPYEISFILDSENIPDLTIIHEAIHAAQCLKDNPGTFVECEAEAYTMSTQYVIMRYGLTEARKMALALRSANSPSSSSKGLVKPDLSNRLDLLRYVDSYAGKRVEDTVNKYSAPDEEALNYAGLKATRSPKAEEAQKSLKQIIIFNYGLLQLDLMFRVLNEFPLTADYFLGRYQNSYREVVRALIATKRENDPDFMAFTESYLALADAIDAAVRQRDVKKAETIIDSQYLPQLWKDMETSPALKADWSKLR